MESIPIAALAPILIIVIGLQLYCLYDLTRSNVRYLPKWAWAVVLVVGGVVVNLAYLTWGREHA
jgi:MFS superfamily sulfate permease-like transporter